MGFYKGTRKIDDGSSGGGAGGTTDYTELDNKPSINGTIIEGDLMPDDLGLATTDEINEKIQVLSYLDMSPDGGIDYTHIEVKAIDAPEYNANAIDEIVNFISEDRARLTELEGDFTKSPLFTVLYDEEIALTSSSQPITLKDYSANYEFLVVSILCVGSNGVFSVVLPGKSGASLNRKAYFGGWNTDAYALQCDYTSGQSGDTRKIAFKLYGSGSQSYKITQIVGIKSNAVVTAQEIYSTDEQEIGTWIDGKTLYKKTFIFEGSYYKESSGPNISLGILMDTALVQEAESYLVRRDGAMLPLKYLPITNPDITIYGTMYFLDKTASSTRLCLRLGSYYASGSTDITKVVATIKYTKA